MLSSQMFSEWLDAVFPDWYSLGSAMLLGAFGVIALGILVLGLAPHSMFMWMPIIAAFCGASAGYRFREKHKPEKAGERRGAESSGTDFKSVRSRIFLLSASGLGPAAAAIAIQGLVDRRIFGTEVSVHLSAIILACAVMGAVGGGLLRSRYEKINQ